MLFYKYIHVDDDSYLPIVKYYDKTNVVYISFTEFNHSFGYLTMLTNTYFFASSVTAYFGQNAATLEQKIRTRQTAPTISFFKYKGDKGFTNITVSGSLKVPDIGFEIDKSKTKLRDINLTSGDFVREIKQNEVTNSITTSEETGNLKWDKEIDGYDEKSKGMVITNDNHLFVSKTIKASDVFNKSQLPKLVSDISSGSGFQLFMRKQKQSVKAIVSFITLM